MYSDSLEGVCAVIVLTITCKFRTGGQGLVSQLGGEVLGVATSRLWVQVMLPSKKNGKKKKVKDRCSVRFWKDLLFAGIYLLQLFLFLFV